MRRTIVFVVLLVLLGVLGVSLTLGASNTRAAARKLIEREALPAGSASAAASAAPSASVAVAAPSSSAPVEAKPPVDRSLAVIGMGWDLLAPALLAAEGLKSTPTSAFGSADVRVSVAVANTMTEVERALTAGGGSNAGADVAVLPLSELVSAYERVRALELRVLFVSGWSQGRDVLTGTALAKLPATGNVTVAAPGAADALGLTLSMLDLAGVALERVKLDERDSSSLLRARSGTLTELDAAKQEDVVVSSREASRLLPYVLVAPRPLLEERETVLAAFLQGFLAGTDVLLKDRPKAARTLAALEGAPEAMALLRSLGDIEPIRLYENAAMLGLSGRSALTAESLIDWQFRIRRAAHVGQTATPDASLVDGRVVARLVRSHPKLVQAPEAFKRRAGSLSAPPLLERAFAKEDEQAIIDALGLLAAVFPRYDLRLTLAGNNAKVQGEWLDRAATRYDLDRARLIAGTASRKPGRAALLEVLRAP